MKKIILLALYLFCFSKISFARVILAKGNIDANFQLNPSFLSISALIKTKGEFKTKVVETEKIIESSLGERRVLEAKARVRAELQAKKSQEKTNKNLSEMDQLKIQTKNIQQNWKKETKDLLQSWQREQNIFLGKLKVYKENTFVIPVEKVKIKETKVVESLPEAFVVNGAFDLPIRDQEGRPTCAAFAGIRMIEILLTQNDLKKDLSPQYLYWASKPECQKSPCSKKGSWVTAGYKYSLEQKKPDIPLAEKCSYQTQPMSSNETQVPLAQECMDGFTRVEKFESVESISDILLKIKNNTPVVMGAKLTENFYITQGLVTLSEVKNTNLKMDEHALGHAFLAVGFHELPNTMKPQEGNFCIIVANSWGLGWGAGGYACLTENWLKKYRLQSRFLSVTGLEI